VVAVRDHLAHQRRVVGGDVVADEFGHVGEAHDTVVEIHPGVHLTEAHVADHMVERRKDPTRRAWVLAVGRRTRDVTGEIDAVIA
jgi:hypothetical protein